MRINGVPNKYEIYQDYYLEINGEEISYTDALRLYYQMDAEQKNDFAAYYKDETGYEIVDANGRSLGEKVSPDKKNTRKAYIQMKYNIEAYAKKNGIILDPVWSKFSAEEIMEMKNEGVNIPQDIVDVANTILQTSAATYNSAESDENSTDNEVTEKQPYLELIPKAKKNIEKCEETDEKLNDEINAILPEKQKQEKSLKDKLESQQASLKEYEDRIREWRTLQNKVNNGEALTDSEAARYAEITGMLEDKNSNSDDFQIDKNEITKSLNKINILAVLGEDLAEETVEIGEALADYTSETNYKTTRQKVSQEIGILRTIMAMANGKTLANEALEIGNNTKEYTEDTTNSVKSIASLLGVQNNIANPASDNNAGDNAVQEIKSAENTAETTQKTGQAEENIPADNDEKEQAQASEQTNDTPQEDFIITDDNVKDLINESGDINTDLIKQFAASKQASKSAKSDNKAATIADKKITKIVKEYQEEEARRQEAIKTKEDENEKAKKELESLTGKSSEEIDQELSSKNSNNSSDENMDETTKNKVKQHKQTISDNNTEIQNIKNESQQAIQEFKNNTLSEKSFVDKAIPEENTTLGNNSKYLQETLPQHKERLNFTQNSGKSLTKMGKYRVTVGMQQIASFQMKKGLRNVAKGTVSIGIGLEARIVSNTPVPKMAEKSTKTAIADGGNALSSLNTVNSKIVSVIGEDTANTNTSSQNNNNEQQNSHGNNGTQTGAAAPVNNGNSLSNTDGGIQTSETTGTITPTTQNSTVEENAAGQTLTPQAAPATKQTQKITSTPANTTTKEIKKSLGNTNSEETAPNNAEENTNKDLNTASAKSSKTSSSEKEDEEMTTDDAQDSVDNINASAKDGSNESEKLKKDTDKTTKELEKETKQLTKLMKKDEKEVTKMTKESLEAAQKQEEILKEYETLVNENEQLIAEDENNQQLMPVQQPQDDQGNQQGGLLGNASMTIINSQGSNTDKIEINNERINELGISFSTYGKTIDRNRTKIVTIQKTTKTRQKKLTKKTDLIEEKNKEAEKKELEKQKRLQKQLGAVGIAENVFQVTLSTGMVMMLIPWTAAAGAILVDIGTYGVVACGVTKATINLANGNLTGALMSLGQCAISAALSMTGTGAAAGGVLGAVSSGLSVVASSAELVNNVRAVQGKEASGLASKISTIAGVASSLTSSAATLSNLGKSGASAFGTAMQIAGVTGSALSSASQLMTEFGAEGKAANILGMIGGATSTIAALGMIADRKFGNASQKNEENQEKTEAAENNNENTDNNTLNDTQAEQSETQTQKAQDQQVEQQAQAADKQAEAEVKQAEQQAKAEEQKAETSNNDASDEQPMTKEERKAARKEEKRIKNNITKEGASEEYADIDTEDLQNEMFAATDAGDKERARALALESTRRNYYKAEIAPELRKENRQKIFSNVMNAITGVTNTAGSFFSGSGDQGQPKKKNAPAGKLTERTKQIIEKHKKRVAALAAKGYNLG